MKTSSVFCRGIIQTWVAIRSSPLNVLFPIALSLVKSGWFVWRKKERKAEEGNIDKFYGNKIKFHASFDCIFHVTQMHIFLPVGVHTY